MSSLFEKIVRYYDKHERRGKERRTVEPGAFESGDSDEGDRLGGWEEAVSYNTIKG